MNSIEYNLEIIDGMEREEKETFINSWLRGMSPTLNNYSDPFSTSNKERIKSLIIDFDTSTLKFLVNETEYQHPFAELVDDPQSLWRELDFFHKYLVKNFSFFNFFMEFNKLPKKTRIRFPSTVLEKLSYNSSYPKDIIERRFSSDGKELKLIYAGKNFPIKGGYSHSLIIDGITTINIPWNVFLNLLYDSEKYHSYYLHLKQFSDKDIKSYLLQLLSSQLASYFDVLVRDVLKNGKTEIDTNLTIGELHTMYGTHLVSKEKMELTTPLKKFIQMVLLKILPENGYINQPFEEMEFYKLKVKDISERIMDDFGEAGKNVI